MAGSPTCSSGRAWRRHDERKRGWSVSCQQCIGLEKVFGRRAARSDLERYRRKGPSRSTRELIRELVAQGVSGTSHIDIGSGVGAVPLALLAAGAASARLIDASHAYLAVAEEEAVRQGQRERMSFRFGDFATIAADEPAADVVTLDRVICCYHDATALIDASASRATRLYGLVYPRDTWFNRLGSRIANAFLALSRNGYRSFIHPQRLVERLVTAHGLELVHHRELGIWQVAVYRRPA